MLEGNENPDTSLGGWCFRVDAAVCLIYAAETIKEMERTI